MNFELFQGVNAIKHITAAARRRAAALAGQVLGPQKWIAFRQQSGRERHLIHTAAALPFYKQPADARMNRQRRDLPPKQRHTSHVRSIESLQDSLRTIDHRGWWRFKPWKARQVGLNPA